MSLSGYTAAEFGEVEQDAFAAGIAALSNVSPDAVTITGVTDVARRRRAALASTSSIAVDFKIEVASLASVADVASALTATGTIGDGIHLSLGRS